MRHVLRSTLLLCLATTALQAQATPPVAQTTATDPGIRTIADVNKNLTGTPPHGTAWSPDGKLLTYIASEDDTTGKTGDIVQIDAATGHASILATAEQLSKLTSADVNEKDADHRARYGMSAYIWAADSKHLLLDNGGRLWLYDIAAGTGTLIVDTHEGSGDDPKFSPDAKSVSYLHNHNLYVHPWQPLVKNAPHPRHRRHVLNGEVDWVYEEELDVRSNYFWSPDSKSLAYLQMNEADVPQYPIADWIPTHATVDIAALSPARRPQSRSPRRRRQRQRRQDPLDQVPIHPGNDYIPRFGWVDRNTVWIEPSRRDQQAPRPLLRRRRHR